jgi:MYXO-CTERM domain-containing protein
VAGFFLVLAFLAFLGFAWGPRAAKTGSLELYAVFCLLSGLLVVHCWLSLLSLADIEWSGPSVALPLLLAGALFAWRRRRSPRSSAATRRPAALGFGDAIALLAIAAFALCAWRQWIVTSDFFYHWGVKGEKFFLARGIDAHYLRGPLAIAVWYPTLLPELHALTALARGRFDAHEMMAWSALWLALLWLAARGVLRAMPVERRLGQAGIGAVLALCVAAGISVRLAGGADWIVALALVVGAAALLAEPTGDWDPALAVAAATAAAAKTEGVVLAALLLGLDLARRALQRPRRFRPCWLASLGPSLLVVALWIAQSTRAGLWPHELSAAPREWHVREWLGTFDLQFLSGAAPTFYLPALLLLIPLLFVRRTTRWLGLALTLQLAFYEAVYLTSRGSPELYVRTTFARLAFQLLPALVVGFVAMTANGEGRASPGSPCPRAGGAAPGPTRGLRRSPS